MPKLPNLRSEEAKAGKKRVVIVGGGFGGLELAKSLKKTNYQVVLIDKRNHHTFQPLLYQVATSGLETSSIIYPFRKRFDKQRDFYFRLGEVSHIAPADNYIETSIGKISYDYLIIATGATTNFYGMEDMAKNAIPMKTIEDSILLRNKIIQNFEKALLTDNAEELNSLMDFVIVGGGPTGVEVAGALAELKKHVFPRDYPELDLLEMDIHLVEASPRLLGAMSESSSTKAKDFLEKMGVQVHLETAVKSFDGDTIVLSNDTELKSKTLVWAAGITGSPLEGISKESLVRGNRLKVNGFNQVEGYENIFAIGDVAAMIDEEYPRGHPQMAPGAIQQGKHLANNLKNLERNKELIPFKYFHKGAMATIGRNKAVVDLGKFKSQGFFAWLVWMFVHLMSLVGFRNRILVLISWVWSYFSYDKSNRLIIGNLGVEEDEPEIELTS